MSRKAVILLSVAAFILWLPVKSEEVWAPLRLTPEYDLSLLIYPPDIQRLIKNVLVPGVVQWFSEAVMVRRGKQSLLLLSRDCPPNSEVVFIRDSQQCCQNSCAVVTMCGPVPIPERHLQPCSFCDRSGLNCTTVDSQPTGINNTDFVLYVSALSDQCNEQYSDRAVYGGHCRQEPQYDRPIAGYLNFCPSILVNDSSFDHKVGLVFHELVKILVFSKTLLAYYHDDQGLPRSQRLWDGSPIIINGGYAIGSSTLLNVNGPSGSPLDIVGTVVTPRVMKAVAMHFNCSLIGGQLQHNKDDDDTHWEKLFFGYEVMTGSLYDHYVVSEITLALFEDSGWYRVNYKYAQPLDWGRNRGCDFVLSSCSGLLRLSSTTSSSANPFCTDADWRRDHHKCVNSGKSVGDCAIQNYSLSLPQSFQLLPPNLGGIDGLADYCPMYMDDAQSGKSCKLSPNAPGTNMWMESYGPASMCVPLSKPWTSVNARGVVTSQSDLGAGCYQINCTSSQVLISIRSQVIYCQPGVAKDISVAVGSTMHRGGVVCPAYEDVCAAYRCLNRCSNNGQCSSGNCICNPGYFGDDCSRTYLEGLQTCSSITCSRGAPCLDTPLGARCTCPPGYTGTLCNVAMVADPCAQHPCGGRGLCYRTAGGLSPECHCYQGYTGTYCQQLQDFCRAKGVACVNGRCTNDSVSPHCTCLPGYSGSSCNQLTDRCALAPCKNGGLCTNSGPNSTTTTTTTTDSAGTFSCRCPMGFKGNICQLVDKDPCPAGVCANGSSCYPLGGYRFVCACPGMGSPCGSEWVEVCPLHLCLNGGQCAWNGMDWFCLCAPGTAGSNCSKQVPVILSFLGNGYTAVPVTVDNTTGSSLSITIALRPGDPRDGLILHWEGPTTVLALGVRGLSPVFTITTGEGSGDVVIAEVINTRPLDLGVWHSVTMWCQGESCGLYVTAQGATTRSVSSADYRTLLLPLIQEGRVFVGGHPNITVAANNSRVVSGYRSGFVGCISHLEVSGVPISIAALAAVGGAYHNAFQCEGASPCSWCDGTCRSSPVEGFWCECGPSKGGAKCNEDLHSPATFNHSYLLIPLNTNELLNNITITVISRSTSGLLLLLTATPTVSGAYVSVFLNNTNITVETRLVSGEVWKSAVSQTVVVGIQQDILLEFSKGKLISINKTPVTGNNSSVMNFPLMYLGGVSPWQSWTWWEWWSGYVLNATVNGQLLPLTSAVQSMNVTHCL